MLDQLARLKEMFPQSVWRRYDASRGVADQIGMAAVFGRPLEAIYDFRKADVVLSLDADFSSEGAAQVRYARDFASRRRLAGPDTDAGARSMSRFYAVETTPSITGTKADHRLPLASDKIAAFAEALAAPPRRAWR